MTDVLPSPTIPVFVPINKLLIFDNFRFLAHQHERTWPALEAVRVFRDDEWLILVEGYRRVEDLKRQGQSSVLATISDATITAGLQVVIAIFQSGRFSREAQRKAIKIADDHTPWRNLSGRALAKESGISMDAIHKYRATLYSPKQRVMTVRSDGRKCHRDPASVKKIRIEIRRAIEESPRTTTAAIARAIGCDRQTVVSVRKELCQSTELHQDEQTDATPNEE